MTAQTQNVILDALVAEVYALRAEVESLKKGTPAPAPKASPRKRVERTFPVITPLAAYDGWNVHQTAPGAYRASNGVLITGESMTFKGAVQRIKGEFGIAPDRRYQRA